MNKMTLFGHPDSGHVFKVRLMMQVAEIAHDYQVIDIFKPHEERPEPFRSLAPFQEVPLLLDGRQALCQSNAILIHLARSVGKYGGATPIQFQKATEWLLWEANKIGMCLPQLRFARKFAPGEYSKGALEWLQSRFDSDVERMDKALSDGRSFFLGDAPTIADFSLCGYLYHAEEANVSVPKGVQGWLNRISKLPGWQHPYDMLS